MKKCPYCAEEIQDEAIICRFCNRNTKRANYNLRPIIFSIFIIATFFLIIYNNYGAKQKAQAKRTIQMQLLIGQKQLISSVCLKLDELIGFIYARKTYGEIQEKSKNFMEDFKKLKDYISAEAVGVSDEQYKKVLDKALLAVDDAIAISENQLKNATYFVQNEQLKSYVKSERQRATSWRSMMFASQYEYEQARQIDENAESRLKQIEDKSKMIEELEKEYNVLYTEFINKICDLSAFLNRYNLDSRVLFPNLSGEIQKENSKT